MAFYHGVKSRQNPTALVPTRQISAAIPVAVGCAPIHRLKNQGKAAKNGDIALCYEYSEAAATLGCSQDDDFERWGLSEAAYSSLIMFATAPAIFINLFDPEVHKAAVIDELVTVKNGVGQLAHEDVIEVTDVTAVTRILLAAEGDPQGLITTENGNPIATEDSTLSVDGAVEGTDFTLNHAKGQMLIADGGTLPQNGQLTVSYTYARPEAVTALDAIGGADYDTGQVTGLQLVDRVFPQFRVVPGIIIAPGFSDDPSVAAIMAVKAGAMNTVFRGVALADLPVEGLANYTRVPAYKNNNNLAQEDLYLCWPRCVFGGRVMRMGGLIAAGYLLWKNWDTVTAGIKNVWESVKNYFTGAISEVIDAFDSGFINGLTTIFNKFNPVVLVAKGINAVIKYLTGVDLAKTGAEFINKFGQGLLNKWESIKGNIVDKVTGWLPDRMTGGGNNDNKKIPAFANGGLVTRPQMAMVGEDGAEMIIPLTRRERGRELLSQAAGALGLSDDRAALADAVSVSQSPGSIVFPAFSPKISITGAESPQATGEQVSRALDNALGDFKRQMNEYMYQLQRRGVT